MTHDDLVLDAVRYRRYVGAELDDIRIYLEFREGEPRCDEDIRHALARLEARGVVMRAGAKWLLAPGVHARAKGRAFPPEWQPEDSWILLALLYNRRLERLSTLADLIGTADGINHAIPSRDELHGALNRLASARLVKASAGGFAATERAAELLAKAEAACGREVLKQWDCLRRLLACPCCGVQLKKVRWRIAVTDADVQEAYERYTNGARR